MVIRDCMKSKVFSIPATASILDAATVFVERHVGILPVVDENGKPVGVIRMGDLLTLELPDFVHLVQDLDFVHDFGAVETTRPNRRLLLQPVTTLMKPIQAIEETSGLLRAYARMLQDNLYDLPVVDASGKLVGIVSRVDIGAAVLSLWSAKEKK
ncbi:MAG: CBS domain-containing protein [Anaerolineales bacterium]